MVKLFFKFNFLMVSLLFQYCFADTFTASVNKNPIALGESFILSLQYEGNPTGEPDLSVLEKNFMIINRSVSRQSYNIQGKRSEYVTWKIVLSANEEGKITIPPLTLGQESTRPLVISIENNPGNQGQVQAVNIKVSTGKKTAYIGEQIIFKLTLKSRNGIVNPQIRQLGSQQAFEKIHQSAPYNKIENGIRYNYTDLQLAAFPDTEGEYVFPAFLFQGQRPTRNSFSSFFADYDTVSARSAPISIKVKPKPPTAPTPWIPSSEMTLTESFEPALENATQGEPITWTVSLKSHGVKHEQLPDVSIPDVDGFKWYPDKPEGKNTAVASGLIGEKTFKFALVPSKAGQLQLPGIEIPWWNINSDKAAIARLPARAIQVAPGSMPIPQPLSQTATTPDNRLSKLSDEEKTTMPIVSPGYWRHGTYLFAILWLLTLGWMLRMRWQSRKTVSSMDKLEKSRRSLRWADILSACGNNDSKGCKNALLQWASLQNNAQPVMSLDHLAAISNNTDIASALLELEKALYSNTHDWQGDRLRQLLKSNPHFLTASNDQVASTTVAVRLNP